MAKFDASDFRLGRQLGCGTFCEVFLGTSCKDSSKVYAIKRMEKSFIQRHNKIAAILNEKAVLLQMCHLRVVKCFGTYKDDTYLYFVLQYYSNGDLLDYVRTNFPLAMETAKSCIVQIIQGLEYIHGQGIVHRDIKCENIFIDSDFHLVLGDFGTCKIVCNSPQTSSKKKRRSSFVGTPESMAPEVVSNKPASYGVDIWGLGCSVFYIFTQTHAFRGDTDYLTYCKIESRDLVYPDGMPAAAKDLCEFLLVSDPNLRPSLSDVKDHPFFNGVDWSDGNTSLA